MGLFYNKSLFLSAFICKKVLYFLCFLQAAYSGAAVLRLSVQAVHQLGGFLYILPQCLGLVVHGEFHAAFEDYQAASFCGKHKKADISSPRDTGL